MTRRILADLAICTVLIFDITPAGVFPEADWRETSPESQGIDGEKLQNAMDYLAGECGSHKTSRAVVIRNGWMVRKGNDIDNTHNVWSCTKSFTSTVPELLAEVFSMPVHRKRPLHARRAGGDNHVYTAGWPAGGNPPSEKVVGRAGRRHPRRPRRY